MGVEMRQWKLLEKMGQKWERYKLLEKIGVAIKWRQIIRENGFEEMGKRQIIRENGCRNEKWSKMREDWRRNEKGTNH